MRSAADFSDETIRSFLLGRLSSTEQSVFEEQFLVNEELEARVRLAEFDLTDDYAFGRLSATDQTQFEQTFPLTTERKQKLNVSTALRDRFAPEIVTDALRRKRVCLINKQNAVQRRFTLVKRFHGSLTNITRDQVGAVYLDQLALPQNFEQSIDFPKRARYLRLAYARRSRKHHV